MIDYCFQHHYIIALRFFTLSRLKTQDAAMLGFRAWLLEVLSIVGSSFSLLGMIILLAQYDGKPIFSWYGVNLNTIVSILSTASKGCLLLAVDAAVSQWKWIMFSSNRQTLIKFSAIDSASRGPLGSLQLLWRLRGS